MTPEEIELLAGRLARLFRSKSWIPETVRPEPRGAPGPEALPDWAGAAQVLDDVAPVVGRKTESGPHRPAYGALTAAARGAAAGTGPVPLPSGSDATKPSPPEPVDVRVAVSARHLHVSKEDFSVLFGADLELTSVREISQPGQYAAEQQVRVVGPAGAIDGVRIVGPARSQTQVEMAASDYRLLGVDAPLRHSGDIEGSAAIRLEGSAGNLELEQGAIVTARHLHLGVRCAEALRLADGDRVDLVLGEGDRRCTLERVLVRSGEQHATELHIDTDEAHAFGVTTGHPVSVVENTGEGGVSFEAPRSGRRLVTERDIGRLATTGQVLSDQSDYIITPAAKDRAKAMGIWRADL